MLQVKTRISLWQSISKINNKDCQYFYMSDSVCWVQICKYNTNFGLHYTQGPKLLNSGVPYIAVSHSACGALRGSREWKRLLDHQQHQQWGGLVKQDDFGGAFNCSVCVSVTTTWSSIHLYLRAREWLMRGRRCATGRQGEESNWRQRPLAHWPHSAPNLDRQGGEERPWRVLGWVYTFMQ